MVVSINCIVLLGVAYNCAIRICWITSGHLRFEVLMVVIHSVVGLTTGP